MERTRGATVQTRGERCPGGEVNDCVLRLETGEVGAVVLVTWHLPGCEPGAHTTTGGPQDYN